MGQAFAQTLEELQIPTINAIAGTYYVIDESHGITLSLLGPVVPSDGVFADSNDASVIVKLTYGKNKFLFTGDASQAVESALVVSGYDINVDVLKIGHHGSKTSTSSLFLKHTSPDVGIISAGRDNRYGHPHSQVTQRLYDFGIPFIGTYEHGSIVMHSDGEMIYVK